MTRLLTCGYETGDINEAGASSVGASMTHTVVSNTPTPRGASYCFKIATTGSTINTSYKQFQLGSNKTEVWVRCAVYFHPLTTTAEWPFLGWQDSASGAQVCVTWNPTDLLLRARQNIIVSGTLLGTSSAPLSADAWHLLEWRWQGLTITTGAVEVWLDGTRVINFSGDTTATSNVNVQALLIGQVGGSIGGSAAGTYFAFDDLAINDTSGTINNGQIFDGRVVLLKPNGAGSNTAQTRGGTDSGANWSQCEELPPSMTDYVYSATAATRDTYALEDLPAGNWSVNCVEVLAYAQNSDALAGSLGLTVKSGATTNEGTAQGLTTSAAYYRQLYETDPATTAAWTTTAVNALEAGTTVR